MQLPNKIPEPELSAFFDDLEARIRRRESLALSGLKSGGKAWLIAALARRMEAPIVVVCDSLRASESLAEDIAFFGGVRPVFSFPHWDTVPFDGFSPNKEVIAQRFSGLAALLEADGAKPGTGTGAGESGGSPGGGGEPIPIPAPVLVTTPQAWMQGMMPVEEFLRLRFSLRVGQSYPRRDLLARLSEAGYVRVEMVEAPGEFGVRGEIVDLFPIQFDSPVRLDFFDDLLETMRLFDVSSQVSFEPIEDLHVYPSSEGVLHPPTVERALKRLPHFKAQMQPDYYRQLHQYLDQGSPFPGYEQMLGLFYPRVSWLHEVLPENTLVVMDEPALLERTAGHFFSEVLAEHEFCLSQGNLALPPEEFYLRAGQWQRELERFQRMETTALALEGGPETLLCPVADNGSLRSAASAIPASSSSKPPGKEGMGFHVSLGEIVTQLKAWRDSGAPVYITSRSETGADRLRVLLAEFDVGARLEAPNPASFPGMTPRGDDDTGDGTSGNTSFEAGDFILLTATPNHGFRLIGAGGETLFALVTEEEILGERTRQRRLKKSKLQHFIASLGELKEGGLVVHVEYGIGRYEGLRRIEVGGEEGDFLVLAYAGGDKVYVPVYKFNQVQKFTGVDDAAPALNRLGDGAWQRSKARASRIVEDMTEELVAVQAARMAKKGFEHDANTAMVTEFEETFPFQETEDQQTAIGEVLSDLAREQPMDRLVCGDVGFGKTEVAMRASYQVVLGGRQVMMLVPTTILAQQHYDTFTRRFEHFAVRIDVLSRFRTPAEQKKVTAEFARGGIDILIGTHRLLSRDVDPKSLGLLVIDEEQRFGVRHKEKIKRLRTQVDVLTLSATPIPRTLHMSLMGVRDLSIINTAPMDRVAIRTRLAKSSDYIITESVEREVRRGGQVFIVQNRVENIHRFGNYVSSLLPHLRIAVAHGQMPEKQLEAVMLAFVQGEVDVLISTSIIESGLDIPRANTIIVNQADRFGLSQLYQLRGRVGRSNVQAYAYLLVSPEKVLTDVAQKRLTLLSELNDLGSGFKIASHDLEIRGAGNLLGGEQSGHVNKVGLELFTRMVDEAIARHKGEEVLAPEAQDCKLELGFPYLLPEGYIAATQQRLEVYKQLAEIKTEEELWEVRQQLEDRYGRHPAELMNLFELIRIRLLALRFGLTALEKISGQLQVSFGKPEWVDVEALMTLVSDGEAGLQLLPNDRLALGPMPATPEAVLERLRVLETVIVQEKAA